MVKFKQKCMLCRKNYALIESRRQKPICTECQTKDFNKPIDDPKFKKLFDIDTSLYEKSYFLRDIKSAYLRFGNLTERQIDAFEKVAEEMSKKEKEKKE
jgi:hypothetical protein